MVEITLPIVLQILQTAGILVGIIYYITIMRNSQRSQQIQIETRQAQLFMQFMNPAMSGDKADYWQEIMEWEWSDYDELKRIRSDPKNNKSFSQISYYLESLGSYVRLGYIPIRLVAVTMSVWVTGFWNRFGSMIVEQRVRTNTPRLLSETEHLYNELMKYIVEHPELKT
jgi:hypothetical protein